MTTETVCAGGEQGQRILGAVGFFRKDSEVKGNDQLYIKTLLEELMVSSLLTSHGFANPTLFCGLMHTLWV